MISCNVWTCVCVYGSPKWKRFWVASRCVRHCLLSHLGFIYLYLLVQTVRSTRSSLLVWTNRVIHCCMAFVSLSHTSCYCVYFVRSFFFSSSCPENCISCHLHLKKKLLIFVDALFWIDFGDQWLFFFSLFSAWDDSKSSLFPVNELSNFPFSFNLLFIFCFFFRPLHACATIHAGNGGCTHFLSFRNRQLATLFF